ncbi:UNVERIFIED_CONTAM: hypothetical protein FKN15_005987 [Acipenser sinensis]
MITRCPPKRVLSADRFCFTLQARLAANPELPSTVGSGIAWTRTGDLQAIGRILHSTQSAFTGCGTQEPPGT